MSVEAILSGLDMLLKELERKSAEEEQQKFLAQSDIDQAYEDYLDEDDSGYDNDYDIEYDEDYDVDSGEGDDYDEDEDDGFVIGM